MPIVITVSHIVVSEYNTNAVFTVRLSEADPLNLVTVNWSLSGMTADSGSDFTYLSGLLSFDPGVVEQTISVPIIDDAFAESPETFQLNLYAPSTNAEIGNSVAVATIIDNDAAAGTPVVQVGDAVVDEATGLVQVALLLDRPSLDAVTVNCAVQEATAAAASDFTVFPAATIAFAPGETVKLVTVGILDDATVESTEVFDIVLSNVIGATVGDGRGHVFINGNDQQPELLPVVDLRNAVAVEGQGYVDFLVTLSSPGASAVSIYYQTAAGTAASYDDFISQAGTLTFSPGETIKTVRVSTVDDAVVEGQEAFTLQLYSPTNATLGSAVGTATILDNDGPPPSSASLDGGTAADILRGTSFADAITGGDGDDVLDGAGGDDSLSGGAGDDTYLIEDAGDSYSEAVGEGTDLVISYLPTLTLGAHVENLQLAGSAVTGIGNALDNRMTGSVANNTLEGGAGNDTLDGGAGLDTASYAGAAGGVSVTLASPGVQQNTIGAGLDTLLNFENLTGSAFDDQLTGTTGANRLTGGAGNDLLDGGSGADSLLGGLGNDTYLVDDAGDIVVEDPGAGTDTVQSSVGRSLGANQENLTLTGVGAINGFGNSLDNLLQGNSAANYLDGGSGADTMAGGLGNDTYIVDNAGDVVTESDSAGTDTTRTSVDGYTLTSNVEWLVLTGTAHLSGNGNGLNNYLIGNTGHNTLDGGVGADTMSGGAGNDTYLVDNAADVISELSGEGTDTVRSSVTRTLGAYQDNLILTGSTAIDGSGNSEANVLTGNANNNVLDGGAGADTMTGGAGDDTYVVDHTGDVITEYVGQGIDTIQSTVSRGLGSYQENLTLTGSSAINGYGNSLANVITGNGAANYLDGGTGADTMSGGLGDDTYIVDHVGDVVTEGSGAGKDTVRTALDGHLLENNVEWLVLTGTAHLSGYGNGLNNYLIGNTGNNTLDGGVGADTMTGGVGDDTYFVDNTGDIISELAGQGIDTVRSTISRSLGSNQENLTLIGGSTINGYGNTLANTLIGNDAANYLDGATGADTMSGGLGDDTYIVDNIGDVVTEGSSAGKDTVRTALDGHLLENNVEWLVLTGVAHLTGFGNGLDNYLIGNTGNNTLDGGVGADTMTGGVGNDTYFVDNTGDIISELAGQGTDTVISSVTRYLGSNQENLTLTGASALNGYGSNDDNFLQGNSAANLLSGSGGADTLAGGLGNDSLTGGSGADKFLFDSAPGAGNVDTLSDFLSGTDIVQLAQANFSGLAVGAVAADAFIAGAGYSTAADADDRLIYNTSDGALYYDADGLEGDAAVQFAVLTGHPTLLSTDFLVS
jgi:Ca2+-binding RTX toxin-like protein